MAGFMPVPLSCTMDGVSGASEGISMFALFGPFDLGRKTAFTMQADNGVSVWLEQLSVSMPNSLGSVPLIVTVPITRFALPGLEISKDLAGEMVSASVMPKSCEIGETEMAACVPVPLKGMFMVGLPGSSDFISIFAFLLLLDIGEKIAFIVQTDEGAKVLPEQLLSSWILKSPGSVLVSVNDSIMRSAEPVLEISKDWGRELVLTFTEPKLCDSGKTETTGPVAFPFSFMASVGVFGSFEFISIVAVLLPSVVGEKTASMVQVPEGPIAWFEQLSFWMLNSVASVPVTEADSMARLAVPVLEISKDWGGEVFLIFVGSKFFEVGDAEIIT